MIETTNEYKHAIKADTELTTFRGRFEFIPDGAISGAVIACNGERVYSKIGQLKNEIDNSVKYASIELGRWKLDGTFDIVDNENEAQEVGYMSAQMCDADGVFEDPPMLFYTLDKVYDIVGLTIIFDELEYAKHITVEYYDESGAKIQGESFTNEKNAQSFMIEYPCIGVGQIVVSINEWSVGNRFAKICEFLPGPVFVFDDDNTYSFELHEVINPFDTAIEFPEFTLTFDNSDSKFDVVNPTGLAAYLRQLMPLKTKLGLNVGNKWEYVPMGDFYIWSWPVTGQTAESSFTCRPLAAFKTGINYTNKFGSSGTLVTVEQVATKIFELTGITNYSIDDSLKNIEVNSRINAKLPIVNAMGQLAIAAIAYWKVKRDGTLLLVPLIFGDAVDTLTYDELYSPPDIEQTLKVTSVSVTWGEVYIDDEESITEFRERETSVSLTPDDGTEIKEIESLFIPTIERARAVGNAALEYYNRRLTYNADFRGDMSIEAGDILNIQNDYSVSKVLIMQNDITWDTTNKLGGTLVGIGG